MGTRKRSADQRPPHVTEASEDRPETIGAVEHYGCGVAGLLIAGAVAFLTYPTLLTLSRMFEKLSTTMLILFVILLWSVLWLGLELAWEWRAGRLFGTA